MSSTTVKQNISSTIKVFEKQTHTVIKPTVETCKKISESSSADKTIRYINLDDFPSPSSHICSRKEQRSINLNNTVENRTTPLLRKDTDPRSTDVTLNANNGKMQSFTRTKACRNVTTLTKDGDFGVCTRQQCTFAHSTEELAPPMCIYDSTCRFLYGRRDYRTSQLVPNSKCKFRHSHESQEDWLKRSGANLPNLPATSEKYRKPAFQEPEQQVRTKTDAKTNQLSSFQTSVRSRPTRWDETPKLPMSSKSEYEGRRPSYSPKCYKMQIIRVPNEEIAEIAIRLALESGQYNLKIIIE